MARGTTRAAGITATAFMGPGAWGRALRRSVRRRLWRGLTGQKGRDGEDRQGLGRVLVPVLFAAVVGMFLMGAAGITVANMAAESEEGEDGEAGEGTVSDEQVPEVAELTEIPEQALYAYASASRAFDVDWAILAGIGMVECSHGTNAAAGCNPNLIDSTTGKPQVNSVGARGPMQFLGSTWRAGTPATEPDVAGPPVPEDSEGGGYATDGDEDGIADPWNWYDATHSTARYLVALGVEQNPECAAFGYNQGGGVECDPSHEYPTKVMQYADEYRTSAGDLLGGDDADEGEVTVGTACPPGHRTGNPSRSQQGHVTNAMQRTLDAIVGCFGRGAGGLGCYRSGGKGEHPRGRACDLMVTGSEHARGEAMAEWLTLNARELDVLIVIWDRAIWNVNVDGSSNAGDWSRWRPYSGESDHTDHVHVSIALQPGDPSWAHCTGSGCYE
jgi:hypothetical protein